MIAQNVIYLSIYIYIYIYEHLRVRVGVYNFPYDLQKIIN